jgi:predicted nucleic acid-binding protein
VLPDSPLVYPEWKRLILEHSVTGVRAHDARLVAVMNVHGVRRILTFDRDDFASYDVEVVYPVLAT